jgi:hypothetical protein
MFPIGKLLEENRGVEKEEENNRQLIILKYSTSVLEQDNKMHKKLLNISG